ncbi:MAG: response regulator [Flavobacteriales bacterium]
MMLTSYPLNILLVDDDEIDIMAFQRALKKTGIDIKLCSASNAEQCLEILKNKSYDCIFFDYQLPGTDGLTLLKKVRAIGIAAPIAVLTSQGDEKIAVEMMKAGAFDYFPKAEVNPETLARVIRQGIILNKINRDKEEAEKALRENNQKLNAILESTSSMIFSYDNQFEYTAFNSIHADVVQKNYGVEISLGMNVLDIFGKGVASEQVKTIFQNALAGEAKNEVMEIGELSLNTHFYEMKFKPIIGDNGEVKGVAVYGEDFEERKQAERDILQAKIDAEQMAKRKSEFLSNMSHEIRTPMNAIIGLSELLLRTKLEDNVYENIKSIKYSADNLLVIINDILDFSKIESGKIEFEDIDFDLYGKVNEIKKTFIFKAKEKGIDLNFEIDDNVPEMIKGDPYRLNQILLNLLSNAIKFTERGSVTLKVENLREYGGNQMDIQFSVKDTGIGIPENKLNSVFESYTQASADTTRNFGGTGLGLAITRRLVILQNGEITLNSKLGEGTTFTVRIPYRKSDAKINQTQEENIETLEVKDLSGVKVLIVEDNKMNQFVAGQVLELWNVQADFADNGLIALDKLKSDDYDLVLMDLQMPVMDGIEATLRIRDKANRVRNPEIAIIALTADAFPETKEKVLMAGMNDLLTKPLEQEELFKKIRSYSKAIVKAA